MFEFAASIFIILIAAIFAGVVGSRRSTIPSAVRRYGPLEPEASCPKCGVAGGVHARSVQRKVGVSTPKLIAGVLTGGLALLAIGMHRHEEAIEGHCVQCSATWIR